MNFDKLPVIAYYPVNRVIGSTRPDIPEKDSIYNLDVYENSLVSKANYQSFFEWFRIQDDILNEKAMSRSRWMHQNKPWIKQRVKNLLNLLKRSIQDQDSPFNDTEFNYLINRFQKDEIIFEEPRYLFRELGEFSKFTPSEI